MDACVISTNARKKNRDEYLLKIIVAKNDGWFTSSKQSELLHSQSDFKKYWRVHREKSFPNFYRQ
jgi:hypothetical protein